MSDPTTPPAAARCEPKPCPFCSADTILLPVGENWLVGCTNLLCDVFGPSRPTQEKAVAIWNDRMPASHATHAAALRVVEAARKVRTEAGWLTVQLPARLRKAERPNDSVNRAFRAFDEALAAFDAAQQKEPTP